MEPAINLSSALYLFRPPLFEFLPSDENHRDHEDLKALFRHLDEFEWLEAARVAQSIRYRHFARLDDLFENETNRRVTFETNLTQIEVYEALISGIARQNPEDQELDNAIAESGLEFESAARTKNLIKNDEYRHTFFELQKARLRLSHAEGSPSWPIKQATLGVYGDILARAAIYSEQLSSIPAPASAIQSIQILCEVEETRNNVFLTQAKSYLSTLNLEQLQIQCQEFRRSILRNIDRYANLISLCEKTWSDSQDGTIGEQKESHDAMLRLARTLRESLSFLCLSIKFSQLASLPSWSEEIDQWRKQASRLGMDSVVSDGVNTVHGTLLSNWTAYEGRLVEISGVITGMRTLKETTTDGEKMTSFFTCREISMDKDEIEIATPYSNLPEQGLIDGVPCKLSGTPYLGEDGNWRIRLDGHNYSTHKTESFYDYCQSEIGGIFPLWFLRKNIEAGFSTGKNNTAGTGTKEVRRILVGN